MILLESSDSPGSRRVIMIFGVGLLGSAIRRRLHAWQDFRETQFPFHWSEREKQDEDLHAIERMAFEKLDGATSLALVWSAGRAGFSATASETEEELRSFRSLIGLAERLSESVLPGRAHLVLLSSAGGLFEGQRHVDSRSSAMPRRPYGELKLEQEEVLRSADSSLRKSIVRISSVYGHVRTGRSGLIPTLVANGLRGQATTIVGTMSTLRDFVWADDVAEFVASRVLDDADRATLSTEILASGRPCSIFQIQGIVERRLRSPILVSYVPEGPNRDDITFSRSVLPRDWYPSDLQTNIHRVLQAALGLAWSPG